MSTHPNETECLAQGPAQAVGRLLRHPETRSLVPLILVHLESGAKGHERAVLPISEAEVVSRVESVLAARARSRPVGVRGGKRFRLLMWGLASVLAIIAVFAVIARMAGHRPPPVNVDGISPVALAGAPQEFQDLIRLRQALDRFYDEFGHYPVSSRGGAGWDGLRSPWGDSTPNWIRNLSPRFIDRLPRDPRGLDDMLHQYMYRSDGFYYKLLVNDARPEVMEFARRDVPFFLDPPRSDRAIGIWSHAMQNH